MQSKSTIRVARNGTVVHEEVLDDAPPDVRAGDATGLADISRMTSIKAGACVYCGSTDHLSREHVIPYALGGALTILKGSCERCRRETHRFETDVLTGPMRMVRYIQNLPSSSKYRDVPKLVPIAVTTSEGAQHTVEVPIEDAPILLAFCEFGEPKYLEPHRGTNLETGGIIIGNYGQEPEWLVAELSAKDMRLSSPPMRPVSFARMIAKIAYCFAYYSGHISKLENPEELVDAFMQNPNMIGRFVGSMPPPYVKYDGLGIRLAFKVLEANRIASAEVQLFAASGAPTYVVVLGKIKDGEILQ